MKTNFSLRMKIIGMVLGIIGILGAASFVNIQQVIGSYKSDLNKSIQGYAIGMSEKIASAFAEGYDDAQIYAMSAPVKSLDTSKLPSELDAYVKFNDWYDLIVVVDKNGNFVGSSSRDPKGNAVNLKDLQRYNFKDTPWFKSVVKGDFTEDKDRGYQGTLFEDFIEDPLMKVAFGESRFGSSFSAAIKDASGNLIGVISNRTNKKWLEDQVSDIYNLAHQQGLHRPEATVVNKDGMIIAYASGDEKTGELQMVTDPKRILKENFADGHVPAGRMAMEKKTGVVLSKYVTDDAQDIVGYHYMDDKRWISNIGWITFVHDSQEDSYEPAVAAIRNFYLILAMVIFISVAIAVWFGMVISKQIDSISVTLAKNSEQVSGASAKIASSASELSEAATEQAAALQETVAAVDEITAMVEKNSEAADRSKDMSAQSRDAAEKGRRIVENVLSSISEIDRSNQAISEQMAQSNRQLSEITALINDIGSKTKVINEIVFQTKLLSFNASVEAARAGEYGKGFAVVAEEVGNLAQMSGNAAKEISTLLQESVRKVEGIVSETKTKVDKLMSVSNEKVKTGNHTAQECNEALNEILDNVQAVDTLVSEIAVASSEQSTGIREISKAVGQMEQVVQQNSAVAQSSAVAAEQLRTQSSGLNSIVKDLVLVVKGAAGKLEVPGEPKTNVVAIKRDKNAVAVAPLSRETPVRKAAGSEFTPSADDPGFAE
jgi:methyl-accepting chemotaxis protein